MSAARASAETLPDEPRATAEPSVAPEAPPATVASAPAEPFASVGEALGALAIFGVARALGWVAGRLSGAESGVTLPAMMPATPTAERPVERDPARDPLALLADAAVSLYRPAPGTRTALCRHLAAHVETIAGLVLARPILREHFGEAVVRLELATYDGDAGTVYAIVLLAGSPEDAMRQRDAFDEAWHAHAGWRDYGRLSFDVEIA
jgi:hypothetical protein